MKGLVVAALGIGVLIVSSCTTALVAGADKVRVTSNADIVKGCEYLGDTKAQSNQAAMWGGGASNVDEENVHTMLKNQAFKMGGNVVLLQSSAATPGTTIFRGEVYRCH